jgi:hypothetical protein
VAGEMHEELFLGEEDGCVGFFACSAQLGAEEAAVELLVDGARGEVGLGYEAEAEAYAAVAVVARVCTCQDGGLGWVVGRSRGLPDRLRSASTCFQSSSKRQLLHLATVWFPAPMPC